MYVNHLLNTVDVSIIIQTDSIFQWRESGVRTSTGVGVVPRRWVGRIWVGLLEIYEGQWRKVFWAHHYAPLLFSFWTANANSVRLLVVTEEKKYYLWQSSRLPHWNMSSTYIFIYDWVIMIKKASHTGWKWHTIQSAIDNKLRHSNTRPIFGNWNRVWSRSHP